MVIVSEQDRFARSDRVTADDRCFGQVDVWKDR